MVIKLSEIPADSLDTDHHGHSIISLDGDAASDIIGTWVAENKAGGLRQLRRNFPLLQKDFRKLARELSLRTGTRIRAGDLSIKNLASLISEQLDEDSSLSNHFRDLGLS